MSFHNGFLAPVPQLLSAVHTGVAPPPPAVSPTGTDKRWVRRLLIHREIEANVIMMATIRGILTSIVHATASIAQLLSHTVQASVNVWEKHINVIPIVEALHTVGQVVNVEHMARDIERLKKAVRLLIMEKQQESL